MFGYKIIIILSGVILICSVQNADAISNYTTYDITVNLHDISHSNLKDASFDMQFSIFLQTNNPDVKLPLSEFSFLNGMYETIKHQSYMNSTVDHYVVEGHFDSYEDLKYFPFQKEELKILLLSPIEIDKIRLVNSAVPTFDQLPTTGLVGYNIVDSTSEVTTYTIYGQTFDLYVATYTMESEKLSPFLTKIFPVLVLAIFSYFSLFLSTKDDRLTILSASLIGLIFFHVTIMQDLPPIGYLTFFDSVVISTYIVITICLIPNIIEKTVNDKIQNRWLTRKLKIACPILFCVIFITLIM